MGAWATAQDIDDNDKRFSERYVARQESKVTMLADARCELVDAMTEVNYQVGRRRVAPHDATRRHATTRVVT